MILRAKTRRELKLWVTALQEIGFTRIRSVRVMNVEDMSRALFHKLDLNGDGTLDWDEARSLFQSLGMCVKGRTAEHCEGLFAKYDLGSGYLLEEQFCKLYMDLMT